MELREFRWEATVGQWGPHDTTFHDLIDFIRKAAGEAGQGQSPRPDGSSVL